MHYFILVFLVSLILNALIWRSCRLRVFCDISEGVQKFHKGTIPRIGGCGLCLSLLISAFFLFLEKNPFSHNVLIIIFSAMPVFFSGLLEDITKKVSPFWRLSAGFASGAIAFFMLNARIQAVDLPIFDQMLEFKFLSLLFTCFAISGVSHAFNIIDGFNGLASGVAIMVFGAYAYVAFLVNDFFLQWFSLLMLFSVLGFFVLNYPFGLIFLGDSGAYLLGFVSALIGVLLVAHHPEVSPWFPFLLVIYPVWETIFSMYRRIILRGTSPGRPDAIHLHSLIYKRIQKKSVRTEKGKNNLNASTSKFLWCLELICLVPATLFYINTILLIVCVFNLYYYIHGFISGLSVSKYLLS